MTAYDHLTAATLAASRLDDAEAAKHLGHVVDLDEPHAIAHVTAGRPSLRASLERGGYLHPDHDDASAICLILRAQTEANPERLYARLAHRGYPLLADVAQRSREALDVATATPDDAEKAVGPFPSPAAASGPATIGARLTSPPFAFDDPPPAVARREAFARAWRMLDAGDVRGCIREMLAMMERA